MNPKAARAAVLVIACIPLSVVLRPGSAASLESDEPAPKKLAIVDAVVSSAEDAAPIAASFTFMPGDFVYFQFEVSGYAIVGDEYQGPRQMSLAYTVEIQDAQGIPLAPPASDRIKQEIAPEDKNWLPKRRTSFLLPSYVGAGAYHLKLKVQDLLAKSEVGRDFEFHIGGRTIETSPALSVQNFRFLRDEQDGPGLELPAFRPGDAVWARFDITGYKLGKGNEAQLQYGVTALRPDGKPLFEDNKGAQQRLEGLFYPPQFVPGVLSVTTTPDVSHGEYTLVIHVHDAIGKQSADFQQKFRIE